MPQPVARWPRVFGFEVGGRGPSYVTAVERGGPADHAGLLAGDHLLTVEDRDVRSLPPDAVKRVARNCRNQPPALSVVSHLHQVQLTPHPTRGYGFSIRHEHPILVAKVEPGTPAAEARLAEGDIILGLNGRPVQTVEAVGGLLEAKPSPLLLLFIPIGRSLFPGSSPLRPEVKGHRANQLYRKLNEVLGEDFEKKMAVVGVLKQYAEDRDVGMLCSALLTLLKSPAHRSLLADFRLFIPSRHRSQFDRVIADYTAKEKARGSSAKPAPATHTHGVSTGHVKRTFQLERGADGYGFMLKGSNPVRVDSVDLGQAAARAGLRAEDTLVSVNGVDVRSWSHQSVVDRLRRCEGVVRLDVHRQTRGDTAQTDSGGSVSSTGSVSWTAGLQHVVDGEGRSFKQRMEFLLTPRERLELKGAVVEYKQARDVSRFCTSVSRLLDTPSKQSLWLFLYHLLPADHRLYCDSHRHRPKPDGGNGLVSTSSSTSDRETQVAGSPRSRMVMGTRTLIQQQHAVTLTSEMGNVLTHRERSQLKKALQLYSENRKLRGLLEELDSVLDTPEKQRLWVLILPQLDDDHQSHVRAKYRHIFSHESSRTHRSEIAIPGKVRSEIKHDSPKTHEHPRTAVRQGSDEFNIIGEAAASLKPPPESTVAMSSDSEMKSSLVGGRMYQKHMRQNNTGASYNVTVPLGRIYHNGERPEAVEKPRSHDRKTDDVLVQELQKTRRAVAEAKDVIVYASTAHKQTGLSGELTLPGMSPGDSNKRYITFVPVGYPGLENQPYRAVELSSTDLERIRKHGPSMLEAQAAAHNVIAHSTVPVSSQNGWHSKLDSDNSDLSFDVETGKPTTSVIHSSHPRDKEKTSSIKSSASNSVNGQALKVLKQLDAAMDTEIQKSSDKRRSSVKFSPASPTHIPSPPAPPDLPLAPPPAPPPPEPDSPGHPMNVKRINWEKLSVDNIQDTVWGQIGDTEYMGDVIQFLELEQQFSTVPVRPSATVNQKKNVNLILSPKKAYNISILLGHLKLSVEEMKTALYSMDEEVLTADLLKQLLTYSPSQQEMASFSRLSGDDSDLSTPDQFAYQMSQIPQYVDRLKALLFKATLGEKFSEIKEGLSCISKACKELRNSQKLAKLLELILAMGNHLNKGNTRVGSASAFKISYLAQLDVTKTQDNKHTFVHVLADAARTKYPESLAVGKDLATVPAATKASMVNLGAEVEALNTATQDVATALQDFGKRSLDSSDRFYQVMAPFNLDAARRIESLRELYKATVTECDALLQYFGEDPKKIQITELFTVFSEFITKFQAAHRQNLTSPPRH